MTPPPAQEGDSLTIESRLALFEGEWRLGQEPDLEKFLPPHQPERLKTLIELVNTELELCLKAGRPARVEGYLQRFPEIAKDNRAVLDLIRTEYDIRSRQESALNPEEYERRFPYLRGM